MLKPDGWFTRTDFENGTSALFVSKQDISAGGQFDTGLSLNFVTDVKRKSGLRASQYAYQMLSQVLKGNQQLAAFGSPSKNGVMTLGLRIKNERIDRIILYYTVADDNKDTLYIFLYEAPLRDWDTAWQTGEPMFRNLRILTPK